ncbi:MAG: PH domain-containing protein, partial [Nitriliruptorales bacterium]|nr:PH domain-containing protein [Nitriliruptorales bacterium]
MSADSDPQGPPPPPTWPAPAVGGTQAGDRTGGAVAPPPRLGGRLHPAVMVIWPFNQIFPIAVLLIAGNVTGMIALAVLAVSAVTGLIRYQRFSWRLDERSLVIEQGLIQRRRRVIPLERVQSVDLVRKVRHRMFGVVEVRVEAVGGAAPEGKLDALAQDEAVRLRAALLAARDSGSVAEAATAVEPTAEQQERPPREQLVHLRPSRLVLAGLTGGRVGVVAAMLGVAEQLLGNRITQLFSRLPTVLDPTGLVGLAVVIAVLAFLLSVLATTVAYWD